MLALVLALTVTQIGEPRGVHLLAQAEVSTPAPVNDNPWLMGDRASLQRQIEMINFRLSRISNTLSGSTVVVASLALSVGGLTTAMGGIFFLSLALGASQALLLGAIVMTCAGLLMLGLVTVALIAGNSDLEERRLERSRLLQERNQLDDALSRMQRRAAAPDVFAPSVTLARF